MLIRLNRKKTVIEIMATKSIDNPESLFLSSTFDLDELNATESKRSGNSGIGPASSFIMSRCNMKSVDLAKEKSNLNELHRYKALAIILVFFIFFSLRNCALCVLFQYQIYSSSSSMNLMSLKDVFHFYNVNLLLPNGTQISSLSIDFMESIFE